MSEDLPPLWSQTATDPDILEAPPPAGRQPPIRLAYPASSWFWRNLARTRMLPPEEMVTFWDSLSPVREPAPDPRLAWWVHVYRALPRIVGGLLLVVALVWLWAA